jgi:hypothetical protein
MGVGDQGVPVFLGSNDITIAAVGSLTGPGPSEDISPGIARIAQDLQGSGVNQRSPDELPLVGATPQPPRESQAVLAEVLHHGQGRTLPLIDLEEGANGLLDLPRLWKDPQTRDQDRKRMVRLLVEDVTLTKAQEVRVQIRFKAGATRTLMLPLPPNAWQRRMTRPEVVAEIDRLLKTSTEEQIAGRLNQQGHRSGTGQPFTSSLVGKIRRAYHLRSCYDHLREAGLLTLPEIARQLSVNPKTVKIWRNHGLLTGHPYNDKKECLYEPVGQNALGKHQGIKLAERAHAARVIPNPTNEVHHEA